MFITDALFNTLFLHVSIVGALKQVQGDGAIIIVYVKIVMLNFPPETAGGVSTPQTASGS